MTIDLDKIERDATAAQGQDTVQLAMKVSHDLCSHELAKHIANCSPDVVLALVARVRELERERDDEAFAAATAVDDE